MENIQIRERSLGDTAGFCEFLTKLDNEAEYMMYERGERNVGQDVIRGKIEDIINDGDACYVALDGMEIIGFIIAVREKHIRTNHVACIVAGILEKYCGKGIGTELFRNVFGWAEEKGVKKLELTVITENTRAFNLYKKLGFKAEGLREMSMLKNGKYFDEYYMAKLIN